MSKRAILLLLLPSVIFLIVAGESFRFARLITPREQITRKAIDKLAGEARRGDYGPSPDQLVERLSDSWIAHDAVQSDDARMCLITGWAILFGVAVQVYLVLRLRFVFKEHDA